MMKDSNSLLDNLSIILVNYKTLELTRACLDLLREHLGGVQVPVYVVDNHSADASTDYLRTLDWIHLIERKSLSPETGSMAHGRALDCALQAVATDYALLLHTDTLIHDPRALHVLLEQGVGRPGIAAVGCLEQLDRGLSRSAWRLATRFVRHHVRRGLRAAGLNARTPRPYRERHLKSFCALWNVRLIKQHGLRFQLDSRNPGYELQDRLQQMGYGIGYVTPRSLFRYLDHLQSGTVAANGGYRREHRRVRAYREFFQPLTPG